MSTELATPDARKAKLAQAIQQEVLKGGRVETQADYSAVVRYEQAINHTLHLILTIVTCTMWSLVWLVLWIIAANKQQTVTLTVDEYGNVLRQVVGK